jgi:hypothetical protein
VQAGSHYAFLCFAVLAYPKRLYFHCEQSKATFLRGENIVALLLRSANDSASFKRCEIAKMQGKIDSRLHRNDSSH